MSDAKVTRMNSRRPYKLPEPLICDADAVIDISLVHKYIDKHEERLPRYKYLENLYKGFHDVFNLPEKESWKPDNRLAVNFPRYITDTFLGYAYGVPIKRSHPKENIDEAIKEFDQSNDMEDHDFELMKQACIYGHAYEYLYQDEEGQTRIATVKPKHGFIVYDDTVQRRAMFEVRYGYKGNGTIRVGEVMTRDEFYEFTGSTMNEGIINPYGRLPMIEYALNQERISLFEGIAGMTEVYNKTIGEKANDVDSFAEAYLAILGAELDDDGIYRIRDNRIINLYGTDDAKDIVVQFLQKPTADGSQENLLNRLEKLIYQTSMVANISDENFGQTSGTALAYKLQAMSNLALTADRKMIKSMSARYKLFSSLPINVPDPDAWKEIDYKTTRNIPKNLLEEAQTAQALDGITSQETQLSVLSVVGNASDEIKKMEKEQQTAQENSTGQRLIERLNNGQQNILEPTGSGTAS